MTEFSTRPTELKHPHTIYFTAVSFDRLIEPRVINVTTILDGITLMIGNTNPDNSNSDNSNSSLIQTEPHFPKISPQFSVIFSRLHI